MVMVAPLLATILKNDSITVHLTACVLGLIASVIAMSVAAPEALTRYVPDYYDEIEFEWYLRALWLLLAVLSALAGNYLHAAVIALILVGEAWMYDRIDLIIRRSNDEEDLP